LCLWFMVCGGVVCCFFFCVGWGGGGGGGGWGGGDEPKSCTVISHPSAQDCAIMLARDNPLCPANKIYSIGMKKSLIHEACQVQVAG